MFDGRGRMDGHRAAIGPSFFGVDTCPHLEPRQSTMYVCSCAQCPVTATSSRSVPMLSCMFEMKYENHMNIYEIYATSICFKLLCMSFIVFWDTFGPGTSPGTWFSARALATLKPFVHRLLAPDFLIK